MIGPGESQINDVAYFSGVLTGIYMPTPITECLYCQELPGLDDLMIKICDLKISQLFLFKEQSYKGRCNVVFEGHGIELHELSSEQRALFMDDVAQVAKALHSVFHPDKINFGAYADKLSHLHMHIVPKYREGYGFGGVFEMNPQKVYLQEHEYTLLLKQIKAHL
jgi:ATP adenylyltransferase